MHCHGCTNRPPARGSSEPSVGAFFTATAAIAPFAPSRFSTITGAPRWARIPSASTRAEKSIGPAAANALPALEEATKDGDPTVRSHAVAAVGQVRGK